MSSHKIRILLADDHKLVRQGVRMILERQPDWIVVAETDDGYQTVERAEATRPDVAIVDVRMPKLNGIEVTRQIAKRVPTVKTLVLSMHAEHAYVVQAIEAGAAGYILKDSADDELLQAVAAVAAGRSYISPAVASVLLDDYRRRRTSRIAADPFESLTDRERQILQLLAEGRTSREIADMLSISQATVETHRARVLKKLDIHNTAQLVMYAVRRGIVA